MHVKIATIFINVILIFPGGALLTGLMESTFSVFENAELSSETIEDIVKKCDHFDASLWSPPPQFPQNLEKPFPVKVSFEIASLNGIDNVAEVASVDGILALQWQVATCPWDVSSETSGDNRQKLLVAKDESIVWKPPMVFLNDASIGTNGRMNQRFFVTMDTNSSPAKPANRTFTFFWMQYGIFTAKCQLALELFPNDKQTCSFEFALQRPASLVTFTEPVLLFPEEALGTTTQWQLLGKNVNISTPFYGGFTTPTAQFSVKLARIPGYYSWNFYFPTAVLTFLCLPIFLMPPDAMDRPALTVTIVLALTVTGGSVSTQVPKLRHLSALGLYVSEMFWLAGICMIYQVVSVWLCKMLHANKQPNNNAMPKIVRIVDNIAAFLAMAAYVVLTVVYSIN